MTPTTSTLPTDDHVVEHLIGALDRLGVPPSKGPRLLRQAAFELQQRLPPPPGETLVARGVPEALFYDVVLGFVEEAEAIERGRRAALAATAEERLAILAGAEPTAAAQAEAAPAPAASPGEVEPAPTPERPAPLVGPIPPPGYRPCGLPPWGEP
jgi:hypothetical protein